MNDTDIQFLAISRVSDKRILLTYADPATKKAYVDEVSITPCWSTTCNIASLNIFTFV